MAPRGQRRTYTRHDLKLHGRRNVRPRGGRANWFAVSRYVIVWSVCCVWRTVTEEPPARSCCCATSIIGRDGLCSEAKSCAGGTSASAADGKHSNKIQPAMRILWLSFQSDAWAFAVGEDHTRFAKRLTDGLACRVPRLLLSVFPLVDRIDRNP